MHTPFPPLPDDPILEDDEGWIWLPMEELRELQRERNRMMRDLMDNASMSSRPQ